MKNLLNAVRYPDTTHTTLDTIAWGTTALVIGAGQSLAGWTVDTYVKEDPSLGFMSLGLREFFNNHIVLILAVLVIAGLARTAMRAFALTLAYCVGMIGMNYLTVAFCVSAPYPASTVQLWFKLTIACACLAPVCWYAFGKGWPAFLISAIVYAVIICRCFNFYATTREETVTIMGLLTMAGVAVAFCRQSGEYVRLWLDLAILFTVIPELLVPMLLG